MSKIEYENKITLRLKALKYVHILLISAVFVFVWLKWYQPGFVSYNSKLFNIAATIAYIVCYYLLVRLYHAYEIGIRKRKEILLTQCLSAVLSMTALYIINTIAWWRGYHFRSPLPMLVAVIVQGVISYAWTRLCDKLYFKWIRPQRSIVIYRNEKDLRRLSDLNGFEKQFRVEEYIQNPGDDYSEIFERINGYDVVFIAGINASLRNGIVKYCVSNNIAVYLVPHIGDVLVAGGEHAQEFSTPVMRVEGNKQHYEFFLIKRIFDIFASAIAIVVLSPLFVVIALLVHFEDNGPVFYKQTRLTKGGKEFKVIKFRSMCVDAEKDGVARLASENDSRITRIGAFIRKCRIDELPQLFNILAGDMSIVGPRPERPEIAEQYKEKIPSFGLRLQVKAGLTGYAQVYGRYNTDPYDKLEMDLVYINRMNIFLDLELIFATIAILFSKDSTLGVGNGEITAIDKGDEDWVA